MVQKSVQIALICSGGILITGGFLVLSKYFKTLRLCDTKEKGNDIPRGSTPEEIPQALCDVFSPPEPPENECCLSGTTSSCACKDDSDRKQTGRPNLGLPKKEYLALKKAGQLPKHTIAPQETADSKPPAIREMMIFFATETGNAESFARDLHEDACEKGFTATVHDLSSINFSSLVSSFQKNSRHPALIFFCSTWTGGQPPPRATQFFTWLRAAISATATVSPASRLLTGWGFGIFALGSSAFGADSFCRAGRELDEAMAALGGTRLVERGEEDEAEPREGFAKWKDLVWVSQALCTLPLQGARILGNSVQFGTAAAAAAAAAAAGGGGGAAAGAGEESGSESDGGSAQDSDAEEGGGGGGGGSGGEGLVDVEDLGKALARRRGGGGGGAAAGEVGAAAAPGKMLNPSLEKSLTKQGYKLVGSHSGVKLCRWTKAMLRGRGGCYKHTFYGIASYQCMEATPSLACANKCVFCWRHHKNPVGTRWRWEMDDPNMLVEGFMTKHRAMVREMRGLPGVIPSRLEEAQNIKHCALSLVGEPILYPEINAFLGRLHSEGISSFLVTNAQFPDRMETLQPCTQLYVSVDASNAVELKAVDRPLFSDFWPRFLACIDALARKRQRTVFRLTLVKGFNMTDAEGYAELIRRGRPDFVEVKGVTYTGGPRPQLGMRNVPWHAEVVAFTQHLCSLVDDQYGIASEHAHSCAVLMAKLSFKRGDEWHTWIDFSRFLELAASGKSFGSEDYTARTPDWAVFGHPSSRPGDGGFDPAELRFRKQSSASLCSAATSSAASSLVEALA